MLVQDGETCLTHIAPFDGMVCQQEHINVHRDGERVAILDDPEQVGPPPPAPSVSRHTSSFVCFSCTISCVYLLQVLSPRAGERYLLVALAGASAVAGMIQSGLVPVLQYGQLMRPCSVRDKPGTQVRYTA